jgi:large subunit ribosomal protein L18e
LIALAGVDETSVEHMTGRQTMKSKTLISEQARRKFNPGLVETIMKAKKAKPWVVVAGLLSYPRRMQICKNLDEIEKQSKEGDTIIVPGKVLGKGDVSKKIRIAAINFSGDAREKLKAKKCEVITIQEEIKINPKAEGIKILK